MELFDYSVKRMKGRMVREFSGGRGKYNVGIWGMPNLSASQGPAEPPVDPKRDPLSSR